MKYALLIYGDESGGANATDDQRQAMHQAYDKYGAWLAEKGWVLGGEPLHDSAQATTVRVRGGATVTTDGPFAETKEQLGGFFLIETENLDEAIEAAAACPGALTGAMEIRPVSDM